MSQGRADPGGRVAHGADRVDEVVGKSETSLLRYDVLESTTDDFVTDAVREIGGADIGFSNRFRYAPPLPAASPPRRTFPASG